MRLMWTILMGCAPSGPAADVVDGPLPPPVVCNPGEVAWANGVAYPDVQAALSAVLPAGGTVTVCAGTHRVDPLQLWSAGGPVVFTGETSDPNDTVLEGSILVGGHMLHLQGAGHRVQNLTFTGARHSAIFGSAWIDSVTIDNCLFTQNTAGYFPIVNLLGPNSTITNTTFRDNDSRGILYVSPYLSTSSDRRVVVEDVVFEDNVSTYAPVATLAIHSGMWGADGSLVMSRVEFQRNRSEVATLALGAGGDRFVTAQTIDVDHLTLVGNTADAGAAGLLLETQPFGELELNLSDSLFLDNTGGRSPTATGAALHLRGYAPPPGYTDRMEVTLRNLRFGRNRNDGAFPRDAAVFIDPRFRVIWDHVDFGAGAWRNFPAELSGCARRLGLGVIGSTDGVVRDLCP